eukprot:CAMPEP_0184981786 /NCGR_PEP_ID=MMETSP1098-20130426/11385_1 /TAXON_ID=89044 /ORGANISM="Spumella elongata, Strain CCAP 955/1" /LENGTH=480 /DNA_ID=CAMNT_0027505377 /DNA_START=95 /DNA_END=1537 /DNA_ORIENTATION=+
MGGGASSSKADSMRAVLTNVDALKMSAELSKDESFRQSFAAFVNSGVWVDFLAHYFASDEAFLAAEGRMVQQTGNLLHAYKLPKTKTISLTGISFEEEKTQASKYESVVTSYFSDDEGFGQDQAAAGEGFVDIEDCSIFPAEDFLNILLHVVCPIFVWSGFYAHFLKNGPEEGFDKLDEDEVDAILAGPHTSNQLAIRAQELLLGSAVYFEPTVIADHLEQSDWAKSIPNVVDDLSLCITLFDASLPEPRFVYANKAFSTMTGYSATDLLGKSLGVLLSGDETDEQQSEQIALAMQSEMLSKYAITHYTKAGKAFINLVTVKNCGQYTIVVHFPAAKRVKKADLMSVDDAVVLLTCILTPPTVAQTSSRAVAPVATSPGLLRKLASPMLKVGCKTLSTFNGSLCGSSCDLATVATCASASGDSFRSKSQKQGGSKVATTVVSPETSMKTYGTISSSMSASGSVTDRPVVPMLDFSVIRYP